VIKAVKAEQQQLNEQTKINQTQIINQLNLLRFQFFSPDLKPV
jgi:hypothetical protein